MIRLFIGHEFHHCGHCLCSFQVLKREREERERDQTKTLHQFHPMKSFPLGSSTFERNEGIYKASEKPRNFHLSHLIRYRSQCETKICLFFSVTTVTLRKHQNGK